MPGVGPRTVRALAQVAEVVHGAPYRFTDPARFSIAHGGKDRHPYPVPLKVYDRTIAVMKAAVPRRGSARRRSWLQSAGWTSRRAGSSVTPAGSCLKTPLSRRALRSRR